MIAQADIEKNTDTQWKTITSSFIFVVPFPHGPSGNSGKHGEYSRTKRKSTGKEKKIQNLFDR